MTFRDCSRGVTIGGCLIAAFVFVSSELHTQESNTGKKPEAPTTKQGQQSPPPTLSITTSGPINIEREKTIEPDWAKPNCQKPENHDEADLCEQWRMAKAAEQTVALNQIQIFLGALGFLALLVTIYYSRKATAAAIVAAKAADDAVEITRIAAERQLRAYISVRKVRIRNVALGEIPNANLTIQNAGQTPAYNVTATFGMALLPYPFVGGVGELPPVDELSKSTVGPKNSVQHNTALGVRLEQKHIDAIRNGKGAIVVMGVINYADAFSQKRSDKVRLMYTKRGFDTGTKKMEVCAEGNETT